MNTGLEGRYATRDASFVYTREAAPRPFQIAACHIFPAGTHVSMSTYVRAIARSECNAAPCDPLARLARSRGTLAARSVANAIFRRGAHLSVIRMPIARLENDYGHERRLSR